MSKSLTITPQTKIRELIDAFPELEEKLVEMAPAFKKLKNPVLRNTIARVTTISQAALIGGIDVNAMVNQLRKEAGQEQSDEQITQKQDNMTQLPDWFSPDKITTTVDARPMLEAGHHPIGEVFEALGNMNSGEILKLITGFIPAPLQDKARDKGFQVYSSENPDGEVHTFFFKP